MATVDMMKSSIRSILLDRENEEYEKIATSFAGIPDTLNVLMQRMASAAGMPVSILFGREPAGLNATGEADFQHFYDTIATDQKNILDPRIIRILTLICKAKDGPTKGVVPEGGIELKWRKLKTPNEAEMADIYGKMATADCAYVTSQVLLPEEVALSRFRDGEYSQDTEIDVASRKESVKHNLDFNTQAAEEKAKLGPDGMREAEQPPKPDAAPSK
jgi:phage-related protein (TIGR01555 family)